MKTGRFGESITYIGPDGNFQDTLADHVRDNGFTGFSPEGITSYLTFRHPIGSLTMFERIEKVPFGHEVHENHVRPYWTPRFSTAHPPLDEAVHHVDELLQASIRQCVQGREHLGVTVSGGVDSSLLVAVLRSLFPDREIRTYSAGFYGDDEFEYSRLVAQHFDTRHTEFILGPDEYIGKDSLLRPLIRFKASPLHPNEIALAEAEKRARADGCDIVLCGEGSDDIFGGYGQNFRMYLDYDFTEPFFAFFLKHYRYFSNDDRRIVKPDFLRDDHALTLHHLNVRELDHDMRNWVLYLTQVLHTPGLITRGANAMRFNGFPLGFPYIDTDLVDYTNSLPFEYKVRWKSDADRISAADLSFREVSERHDTPKYILKKVAEKYLDEQIIYRPKKGFPVPFEEWFGQLTTLDLDTDIFLSRDVSAYRAWTKFMLMNLNVFIQEFKPYIRS